MITLDSIIHDRAERGLHELLLAVADYFYCVGLGIIPPVPPRPGLADLLLTLESIHRIECLRPRGWDTPAPALADELPGWLMRLAQQADTIEGPPIEGWPV
jgi:hypothetical protein